MSKQKLSEAKQLRCPVLYNKRVNTNSTRKHSIAKKWNAFVAVQPRKSGNDISGKGKDTLSKDISGKGKDTLSKGKDLPSATWHAATYWRRRGGCAQMNCAESSIVTGAVWSQ